MSKRCAPGEDTRVNIHGGTYFVSFRQLHLSGAAGKHGGCVLEFRNCIATKARRTSATLAFLGLLDLAISFLLADYSCFVLHFLFASVTCLYLILSCARSTYKEVVLTIQGLGIQISSTNWLGYTSSVFLPQTIIGDVIINEGITMCRVVFYLAVVIVRDKTDPYPQVEKLFPLFTDFSPRLTAIEDSFHLLRDAFGLPTSPSPTSDTTMVDTDMANTADVTVSDSELHSTSHNST